MKIRISAEQNTDQYFENTDQYFENADQHVLVKVRKPSCFLQLWPGCGENADQYFQYIVDVSSICRRCKVRGENAAQCEIRGENADHGRKGSPRRNPGKVSRSCGRAVTGTLHVATRCTTLHEAARSKGGSENLAHFKGRRDENNLLGCEMHEPHIAHISPIEP